jgi:flavin reductase (DIM6/NTAB) family NADH-FMN oxidoreductase RutF
MAKPGGTGPVGPFPPSVADTDEAQDEYDRMRRRLLWKMPSGLYVVGSTDGAQRRNGMTINWVTQISFDPKWIGIAVEQAALTHELIDASGVFSLCLIDREDRAIVRKFTKPVDVDLDAKTLNDFPYVERLTGAPILAQSVAYLDCEVRDRLVAGNHTFFVGEVVDCAFLHDEDTEVLRMEDTRMNYGG